MTEQGPAWSACHALVECETGLTIGHLRALLKIADQVDLPDDTVLRARTSWRVNSQGAKIKKITAVHP